MKYNFESGSPEPLEIPEAVSKSIKTVKFQDLVEEYDAIQCDEESKKTRKEALKQEIIARMNKRGVTETKTDKHKAMIILQDQTEVIPEEVAKLDKSLIDKISLPNITIMRKILTSDVFLSVTRIKNTIQKLKVEKR